jgi:hypothetical protein
MRGLHDAMHICGEWASEMRGSRPSQDERAAHRGRSEVLWPPLVTIFADGFKCSCLRDDHKGHPCGLKVEAGFAPSEKKMEPALIAGMPKCLAATADALHELRILPLYLHQELQRVPNYKLRRSAVSVRDTAFLVDGLRQAEARRDADDSGKPILREAVGDEFLRLPGCDRRKLVRRGPGAS